MTNIVCDTYLLFSYLLIINYVKCHWKKIRYFSDCSVEVNLELRL